MEDLDDVIADCRYLADRLNDGPIPECDIVEPSEEEFARFLRRLKAGTAGSGDKNKKSSSYKTLEAVTSTPIGYYLFNEFATNQTAFLKQDQENAIASVLNNVSPTSTDAPSGNRSFDEKSTADTEEIERPRAHSSSIEAKAVALQLEFLDAAEEYKNMTNTPAAMRLQKAITIYDNFLLNPKVSEAVKPIEELKPNPMRRKKSKKKMRPVSVDWSENPHRASVHFNNTLYSSSHKEDSPLGLNGRKPSIHSLGVERVNSSERLRPSEDTPIRLDGETISKVGAVVEEQRSELEKEGTQEYSRKARMKGSLPLELFDHVARGVKDNFKKTFSEFLKSKHFKQYLRYLCVGDRKVGDDDFIRSRKLGRGAFGEVWAGKRRDTGKMYAFKEMSKGHIKAKKAERCCWDERKYLELVDSPFVVGLKYAFQTEKDLIMVLDLCTGGDIKYHLDHTKGRKLGRDQTRFTASQVALGLVHLHSLDLAHRDIKPENILLDIAGHAKISDLGLAIKVGKKGFREGAGTPGYWAPECLKRDKDGRYDGDKGKRSRATELVDFWSLGCVIYEMLTGKCPFSPPDSRGTLKDKIKEAFKRESEDTLTEINRRTCEGLVDYDAMSDHPASAVEAVKALLQVDPSKRARISPKGNDDKDVSLKKLEFFSKVDWGLMALGVLEPIFKPDEDNVNAGYQSEMGEFGAGEALTALDQQKWKQFEFSNPVAFQAEVVELLTWEKKRGKQRAKTGGGCCVLL